MKPNSCWKRSVFFLIVVVSLATGEAVAAQDRSPEGLRRLAMQTFDEGRPDEAERQLRLALDELGRGGNSFDATRILVDLASVLSVQERYSEAEQVLGRAFVITEDSVRSHTRETARLFSNLGALYEQTGRHQNAELAFIRALHLLEENEPDNPQIATVLANLAAVYTQTGKYKQAQIHLQKALDRTEKRLGSDHPDLVPILINFAGLYQRQKKWELAESYLMRAALIANHSLHPDHPDKGFLLEHLGVVHHRQKKLSQAETELRSALELEYRRLGKESFRSVSISLNLARVLTAGRRYEEARSLYSEVLPVQERLLGSKHPKVAATLETFSRLLHTMKYREPAVELEARAKRIRAENAYTRSVTDTQQW